MMSCTPRMIDMNWAIFGPRVLRWNITERSSLSEVRMWKCTGRPRSTHASQIGS